MDDNKQKMSVGLIAILVLFATIPMGLLGAFFGYLDKDTTAITGFAWGIGIAIALLIVMGIGIYGWEWIKKEAKKGKMYPFLIIGVLMAVVISSYLAMTLGSPSCVESDTDNRGSTCLEYADDGYEATSSQKWDKFWGTLPVTVIITSLIAIIVRNEMEKNNKK